MAAAEVGVKDLIWLGLPGRPGGGSLSLRRDLARVIRQVRPRRVVCARARSGPGTGSSPAIPTIWRPGRRPSAPCTPTPGTPSPSRSWPTRASKPHAVEEVWVMAAPGPQRLRGRDRHLRGQAGRPARPREPGGRPRAASSKTDAGLARPAAPPRPAGGRAAGGGVPPDRDGLTARPAYQAVRPGHSEGPTGHRHLRGPDRAPAGPAASTVPRRSGLRPRRAGTPKGKGTPPGPGRRGRPAAAARPPPRPGRRSWTRTADRCRGWPMRTRRMPRCGRGRAGGPVEVVDHLHVVGHEPDRHHDHRRRGRRSRARM